MIALLRLILIIMGTIYIICTVIAIIKFWLDVNKWHNAEKKVEIIASAERSELDGRTDNNNDRGTGDRGTGDGNNNDSTGDCNRDRDNNNDDNNDW